MMLKNIKKNGSAQRSDINLSLTIANAIRKHILSGFNLYNKEGYIELFIPEYNNTTPIKISSGTLNSWITRGNVIPETGQELRAFINRTKEEYRLKIKEQRKDDIVDMAERKLNKILNLRTSQVIIDSQGNKVTDEHTGRFAREENTKLLAIQIKTIKYVLDRLDKISYGDLLNDGNPVAFNLSSLRKTKESVSLEK